VAGTRASRPSIAPKPPSTPEERTAHRELADALSRALDTLPFEQRVAIVLCELSAMGIR